MKEILALAATMLIIVAYIPYIKDTLKAKTVPHVYSWLVSALVTFIAFGIQLSEGARWGALPTFIAAIAGFIVFALSLKSRNSVVTRADTVFFIGTLVAVVLWLIADQPLLSILLIASIDILAFVPTFRKSWKRPDQETVSMYAINAVRFSFAALAVQNYSLITLLYPLSQVFCDGLFALFLVIRKKVLRFKP